MHITSSQTQLVILPPADSPAREIFENVKLDSCRYDELLAAMQHLRGQVYLRDGAIQAGQLAPDGRHELAEDQRSWHILLLDNGGRVGGCLRYVEAEAMARFDQLWIHQCALARCPVWGTKFRRAVETEMARARQKGVGFGEVGGWAVAEERRRTTDPLRMVLAACGLFRLLGGCAGLATATVRHGSVGHPPPHRPDAAYGRWCGNPLLLRSALPMRNGSVAVRLRFSESALCPGNRCTQSWLERRQ